MASSSQANKPAPSAPDFIKTQYAFSAHIRNPQNNAAPGDIEDRRMSIYRDLFFNNVLGFMSNTYPVLKEIMGEERWTAMIRDYFANHLSHTPLFHEMPRELLRYLENEYQPEDDDPSFMLELAHYEWVELALTVADEELPEQIHNEGLDLLNSSFSLSPVAWILQYQFDVHRIGAHYQPSEPPAEPTFIVVYRNREDDIGFEHLNGVTARLLSLVNERPERTASQHLAQIADELNHPNPETVIEGGKSIIADLVEKSILLID